MDEDPRDGRPSSTTRLYVGNLPPTATRSDIETHFNSHGQGKIGEIKLMNGFGFIEYADAIDAREAVPDGTDFMGQRLTVQFAKGGRERDPRSTPYFSNERGPPRNRRTVYRMTLSGLPPETSWQDLKDFTRVGGLDVVYSEIPRERDGTGFVEYETEEDLNAAVAKLDGTEFHGSIVSAVTAAERPRDNRFRSRSPRRGGYGGYPPRDAPYDDYDRRGPPRSYAPRGGYRDRSPPRRSYNDDRGYDRGPPPPRDSRGPPPVDDYPPRRAYPADDYPPPQRGYYRDAPAYPREPREPRDPYANGTRTGFDRPPSTGPPRRRSPPPRDSYDRPPADLPPRRRTPPREEYGRGGYERRGYW